MNKQVYILEFDSRVKLIQAVIMLDNFFAHSAMHWDYKDRKIILTQAPHDFRKIRVVVRDDSTTNPKIDSILQVLGVKAKLSCRYPWGDKNTTTSELNRRIKLLDYIGTIKETSNLSRIIDLVLVTMLFDSDISETFETDIRTIIEHFRSIDSIINKIQSEIKKDILS